MTVARGAPPFAVTGLYAFVDLATLHGRSGQPGGEAGNAAYRHPSAVLGAQNAPQNAGRPGTR